MNELNNFFLYFTDHSAPLNVDAMNIDYISKSNEVWDEMEKER